MVLLLKGAYDEESEKGGSDSTNHSQNAARSHKQHPISHSNKSVSLDYPTCDDQTMQICELQIVLHMPGLVIE